jgi:GNAT superfamily N-acetyltransferase
MLLRDGREVTLRPVMAEDEEFLLAVYASTREAELAQVEWAEGQKEAFLRMQFDAQRREYSARFPDAGYDVILVGSRPAGRIWVGRTADELRLLDIALLPEHQNRGVGGLLLGRLMEEARAVRKPLRHMIFILNTDARRFYERLGFEVVEVFNGAYLHMEWRPDGACDALAAGGAPISRS